MLKCFELKKKLNGFQVGYGYLWIIYSGKIRVWILTGIDNLVSMDKFFGSGMGIPDPYPTHGHPYKYPFNPATTNEIQIPIQPNYHQWNPNIHPTQPQCNKIDASHYSTMEALMRQRPQWCVNIARSSRSSDWRLQHRIPSASKPTMHNPPNLWVRPWKRKLMRWEKERAERVDAERERERERERVSNAKLQ